MSGPLNSRAERWEADVVGGELALLCPLIAHLLGRVVAAEWSMAGSGAGPEAERSVSELVCPALGLCFAASVTGRERLGACYPGEDFVPTAEQPGRCSFGSFGGRGLISFPALPTLPRQDSQLLQKIQHRPSCGSESSPAGWNFPPTPQNSPKSLPVLLHTPPEDPALTLPRKLGAEEEFGLC